MNIQRTGRALPSLLALALPALLISCSSKSSSTPAVVPPTPTVAISGVSSTEATGPVTVTFTFSQPMSAFPASDVVVTGGAAATTTTMVSSTEYTLVVTPPASASGTIDINVAAGAFTDAAGVASAAAAEATQTFDTYVTTAPTVAITGLGTTTVTAPVTVTFTFSQPMTAFPASAVTVTGGTAAAATTMVDSTHYTLVVTPAANTSGTLTVSVAAGAFTDTASVASTAAASASVAFNTMPVVVAPTVAITGTSATAATGPVTLTFTFSQPMTAFPVTDVTVTGGGTAAASTTMVSTTSYTLVVTPAAASTGTLTIGVAAGAFSDTAGVANTAAASVTQTYNTVVVNNPSYTVLDFNAPLAAGYAYLAADFNGEASSLTSTGIPAGAPAGGPVYLMTTAAPGTIISDGTTMSLGGSNSIGALPFFASTTATAPQATIMTMVCYAPAAGIPMHLKVENALNGAQSCETTATTTAIGWQTLTFNFADPGLPNGDPTAALNAAFTYDKISVFPDFLATPTTSLTFYIGPITFVGASAQLAPPLAPVVAPTGPTAGAPAPTLPAGAIVLWDSNNAALDTAIGGWNPNWGQSGSMAPYTAGSAAIWLMNLVNYQGIDIAGPDGGPADTAPAPFNITGETTLHISYWTPDGSNFTLVPIDAGDTQEGNPIASGTLVQNVWTDLDLPITSTTFDPTTLRQLKFVTITAENLYMDNIYFH